MAEMVVKAKKFNAVDLITVVVFAAMFRVLWIVFKMAGVVFPFNHSGMMLFSSFSLVICLAVTKKRFAGVFYTIGWVCINFFLQGEIPHYFACILLLPLLPELYVAARSKMFDCSEDVFHSFKDMMIYSLLYNVVYFIFNFIMIIYVFLIPTPMNLVAIAFVIGLGLIVLGTYLGVKFGVKINALVH